MDLQIEQLLSLSPYGLLVLFGVWLVRWFQKEYWPHHKQKELNREALVVDAIKDIAEINKKMDRLEETGKEGTQEILEDFKDVKNLLSVVIKKDIK